MNTMNTIITFSDWISLISLLLAIISFVFSKRTRKKLDKQQLEINAYMLSNLKEAEINKKKANIEGEIISSKIMRIHNKGDSQANNVDFTINNGNSVFFIGKQKSYDILAGNHIDINFQLLSEITSQYTVIFTWDDESSKNQYKEPNLTF